MARRRHARGLVLDLPDKLRPQEQSIQAAVEAAQAEFHDAKKRRLWERARKLAASKPVKELGRVLREIGVDPRDPDPGWLGADAPDAGWLLRCAEYLEKAPEVTRAYWALYRPEERRYRQLFHIWTAAWANVEAKTENEGKLSNSSSGPLVDFIQSVCPELDGDTIRKAVQRELRRRQIHAAASGGHVVRYEIPQAVLETELERRRREDEAD